MEAICKSEFLWQLRLAKCLFCGIPCLELALNKKIYRVGLGFDSSIQSLNLLPSCGDALRCSPSLADLPVT